MKLMLWLLAFSGYIITAHSSFHPLITNPGGIGGIFKGPNSETIIKGPDGSVITSETEGGVVHGGTGFQPIVVAESAEFSGAADLGSNAIAPSALVTIDSFQEDGQAAAPLVVPIEVPIPVTLAPPLEPVISATVTPIVASVAPVITANVPLAVVQQDAHIIETEIVDTPVIEPNQSSDLVGPSGRISTRGSSSIISGPASTTISEPARVVIVPVVPLQPPPFVEVNKEIPSVLSTPQYPVPGPPSISTSIAPIHAASTLSYLDVSSIAPPLDSRQIGTNWGSTLAPSVLRSSSTFDGDLRNSIDLGSTLAPGQTWDDRVVSQTQYSTVSPIADHNQVWSSSVAPPGGKNNIVQPAFSFGVINNLNIDGRVVSTTAIPEQLTPRIASSDISVQAEDNLQQALINNRQLYLNPTNIPPRNIEPPEIGPIPKGTIDLGTTLEVFSVPRAPGLVPQDIQRNYYNTENGVVNERVPIVDGRLQGGIPERPLVSSRVDSVQNEVIPVDSRRDFRNEVYPQSFRGNVPLLRNTQPNAYSFYSQAGLEPRFDNRGADSSQVQLINIPQPPSENIPPPGQQEVYDDSGSEVLWNRYGRRAKFGKP